MRLVQRLAVITGLLVAVNSARAATWLTSLETAKTQAAASGRLILINFTGSDWCPACQSLRSTVLDKPEFHEFADSQLILLEVDFPRYRQMAALHKQANDQLLRKYGVSSFPTLILAKATGEAVGNVRGGGTPAQTVSYTHLTLPTNREV